MARIKIEDLPAEKHEAPIKEHLSDKDLQTIVGGVSASTSALRGGFRGVSDFDKWVP